MGKALSLEEELVGLRGLRERGGVTDGEVTRLLGSKFNLIAAAGAEMAGEGGREGLLANLVAAFERFLKNGEKTDKGCLAKVALVNALCRLDHRDEEVYLRGLHCVQKEPSFGGAVDTAGELRGRCATALAESNYPHALDEIVPLLVDGEVQARVGAARAVAAVGSDGAAAALKLKLLVGDAEPMVLGEVVTGLLAIAPERGVAFVVGVLGRATADDGAAITAALAESRNPAALTVLQAAYEAAKTAEGRVTALRAIALLRVDGAMEYLLGLVERALHPRAREVVEAVGVRKDDEGFRRRLEEALVKRDDQFLMRYCGEVMGDRR